MQLRERLHAAGALVTEAKARFIGGKYRATLRKDQYDPADYRYGPPPEDIDSLLKRADRHLTRWGSWGDLEYGYDGPIQDDGKAWETYGKAERMIDSWARAAKYRRESSPNGVVWVRSSKDPAIRLTREHSDETVWRDDDRAYRMYLRDGGEPGYYARMTLLMYDSPEGSRLLSGISDRQDKTVMDWETDASKLRDWFKKLRMRHQKRVSISGIRDKAHRFNADMDAAQLQKLLGVVTRFAKRDPQLHGTTEEQAGEREFVKAVFKRWEMPDRSAGIVVRADEYNPKNKQRRRKDYNVTILMWPSLG